MFVSAITMLSVLSAVPFAPSSGHPYVVLVSAAVAFDAVLEVANPLLDVLAPDFLR